MKKGIIILALLILALFSVSCIYASDVNDTIVASEDNQLTDESIQSTEIQEIDNDEVALSEWDSSKDSGKIAISNENERLEKTVTNHTFEAIENEIENNCTIYLEPGVYTGDGCISISQYSNVTIIGNSTILDAHGQTGIFWIQQSSNITIQNIIFKNGFIVDAGAIKLYNQCNDCSISNCTFINNTADSDGGAIQVSAWCHNTRISNCIFINNTVDNDGGAIDWSNSDNGRVNDCIFINNTAGGDGGAINALSCDLNADYNWFGNNANNYNDPLPIGNRVYCDYRLFLDATADPDTISVSDTSNIIFKLYLYNSSGDLIEYDHAPFQNLNLTVTAINGVTNNTAKLGEIIKYNATNSGTGSVTATIENVYLTVNILVKGDLNLVVTCEPVVYGQEAVITVTGFGDAKGQVLAYVGDGVWGPVDVDHNDIVTFIVPDMIQNISGRIAYKDGDGRYNDADVIFDVVVVDKTSTEIESSPVTTVYNGGKFLVATLKDNQGKPIAGAKLTIKLSNGKTFNPVTDENGQVKVSTNALAPNAYTATITFGGDANYKKSVKEVKITVKKATPKITAKNKAFKSTVKTKKYTITLKDNTGKAIKKAKVTLKVKGKTYKATTNSKGKATFKITKLNKKGTFKAVITYKGNKYYNKATKKTKITIKSTFKTVSKGSKDKATVRKIQQALKDNGYYLTYKGHYLMVDGIFESCTERSVKEFQHDNGLKVTGKVDEKTALKLKII